MNPSRTTEARTGGQLLVDALKVHGVDLAFGVPGESYLAVLDAHARRARPFSFIICRQEGGASYMAEAYGKLTGRPASASSRAARARPTARSACTSRTRTPRR